MHAACISGYGSGGGALVGGVTAAKWAWGCAVGEVHDGAAGISRRRTWWSASVLLRFQLPLTAAHGSDESGPLTAAVLG